MDDDIPGIGEPAPFGPDAPDLFFVIVLPIFAVIFVAVVVFIVVVAVRNARRAREHGMDPLTVQTDLAARAMQSDLLSPSRSTEDRLAELDRLLAAGTITPSERDAARARILAGD